MKLTYEGVTIDIGCAQYPYAPVSQLIQVRERSASGIVHVEDFNVLIDAMTYNFIDMSREDYLKLMEFFTNEVNGMVYKFTLEDDRNNVFLVRFTSPTLPFTENTFDLYSGRFTVEETQ